MRRYYGPERYYVDIIRRSPEGNSIPLPEWSFNTYDTHMQPDPDVYRYGGQISTTARLVAWMERFGYETSS